MDNLVSLILICAASALVINLLLHKVRVESVIGYIVTGILVSYFFKVEESHSLELVAEFGIVFLMFTIGLEFSPQKLKLMSKEVFIFGPLQVGITAVILFLIGHFVFGLSTKTNLIVSLSLSLSSTAIVLNLLTQSRKIGRSYGRNSVGVLLFQDIAVIPILLLVTLFADTQATLDTLLLDLLINASIIFVLLFVVARIITPHIMNQVVSTKSSELFVGGILVFVVGVAHIVHYMGLPYSLGAFLAGMVLSETHYKHQVEADLTPFRDLLLGVFFITVGFQVDPVFAWENLPSIFVVMLILLTVKATALFSIMRIFNGTRTSLKSALLLAQCGEFSFVVFETARSNNLFMNPDMGQILVMAIVLTMMMTPFIFRYLDDITDKILGTEKETTPADEDSLPIVEDNQVVILGFGQFGRRVARHLDNSAIPYLGIEFDHRNAKSAVADNLPVIFGNAAQKKLLQSVHIDQARAVIIAMTNEQRILLVSQVVRTVAPEVPVIVCVSNQELKDQLRAIGVDLPIDSQEEAAFALAGAVIERE